MGPRSPLWWELSRAVEALAAAVAITALVIGVAIGVVLAVRAATTSGARWRLRWWLHHRAIRRFVAAVADGDPDRAERSARQLLGPPPARRGRRAPPGTPPWTDAGE